MMNASERAEAVRRYRSAVKRLERYEHEEHFHGRDYGPEKAIARREAVELNRRFNLDARGVR